MKNTTKAAGIAGIVMGVLGIGAAIAGALAKSKDDAVETANQEFDQKVNDFCENNQETDTTDVPAAEEQEAEAPAEEG